MSVELRLRNLAKAKATVMCTEKKRVGTVGR